MFDFSSLDGNVLLTGKLLNDNHNNNNSSELDVENNQFELNEIKILHPSLVTITTSPNGSQTLHNLNTGSPIFTIPPASTFTSTTSTTSKQIITLHFPLLTPYQHSQITSSPYYSSTFSILLQGSEYPPPIFNPSEIPGTPLLSATTSTGGSRSPLLSPRKNAVGGDSLIGVPSFSLSGASSNLSVAGGSNVSAVAGRARSTSLSSLPPLNLNSTQPPVASSSASTSTSSTTLLSNLLSSSTNTIPLSQIAQNELSKSAQITAEEILKLRNQNDQFSRRLRLELEVLESRSNRGVGGGGQGVIIKGFAGTGDLSEKEKEREREKEERGRGRGRSRSGERIGSLSVERSSTSRSQERRGRELTSAKDEELSRLIRTNERRFDDDGDEEEEEKEEVRGRSSSRDRSRETKSTTTTTIPSLSPALPTNKTQTSTIPTILALPTLSIPSINDQSTSSSFRPSNGLVPITEDEELISPNSAVGGVIEGTKKVDDDGESEELEEEDTLFEMDEDISAEDYTPAPSLPLPPSEDYSSIVPPSHPNNSYRPSSFRPSSLAASYASLLLSSSANNRLSSSPSAPVVNSNGTPPSAKTSNHTTIVEDLAVRDSYLSPNGENSIKSEGGMNARREGERKLRDVLAMDVPSHRSPLVNIRRTRQFLQEPNKNESEGLDDSAGEEEEEEGDIDDLPSKFTVGSLPMNILQPPPKKLLSLASTFRPEPELMDRKPSANSSTNNNTSTSKLAPLIASSLISSKKEKKDISPPIAPQVVAMDMSRRMTPSTSDLNGGGGGAGMLSSSLSQSLRNPPSFMRPSTRVVEEDIEPVVLKKEETNGRKKGKVGEDEDEDDEDEFVAPHLWAAKKNQNKMEDLLSRSVSD